MKPLPILFFSFVLVYSTFAKAEKQHTGDNTPVQDLALEIINYSNAETRLDVDFMTLNVLPGTSQ